MNNLIRYFSCIMILFAGFVLSCESELPVAPEIKNLPLENNDTGDDFKFEMAVFHFDHQMEEDVITEANLSVYGDGVLLIEIELPAEISRVFLPSGYVTYTLQVQKAGFIPFNGDYTKNELKFYKSKKIKGKGKKKGHEKFLGPLTVVLEDGLFLWNKLGSIEELRNSEVGPDAVPNYYNNFLPAMFGNGVKPINGNYIPYIPRDTIFNWMPNPLLQPWTIEVWFKPDYSVTNNRISSSLPYGRSHIIVANCWNWDGANSGIRIMPIVRGYSGPTDVYADLVYYRSLGDYTVLNPDVIVNNVSWSAGELVHLAAVFDPERFNGESYFRFYVNGELHGYSSVTDIMEYAVPVPAWNFFIGGHQHRVSQGVVDNLKIYDFAKTDFSDRFTE